MSIIETTIKIWESNRQRTLATLDEIAKHPNATEILGWRPGPGRAHIAWQLVHVGITEELFATERILQTSAIVSASTRCLLSAIVGCVVGSLCGYCQCSVVKRWT